MKRNPTLFDDDFLANLDTTTTTNFVNEWIADDDPTDQNLNKILGELKEMSENTFFFVFRKCR